MWLTREQWSVVLGGLMLEIERSERHKSANGGIHFGRARGAMSHARVEYRSRG